MRQEWALWSEGRSTQKAPAQAELRPTCAGAYPLRLRRAPGNQTSELVSCGGDSSPAPSAA
jgi:hypothetical protein